MAGRIIPLSDSRALNGRGLIIPAIRADIIDYGTPGAHLHGPLALKGRSKAAAMGIPGAGDGIGDIDLGACPGLGGGVVSFYERITNPATVVFQSAPIPYPFMITHILWFTEAATTEDEVLIFYVSQVDSTSTTEWETSQRIFLPQSEQQGVVGHADRPVMNLYPNFPAREPNSRIKVRYTNPGSAARDMQVQFDIIRLPG